MYSSEIHHGRQPNANNANASIAVSQQLLFQLGASISNNVVHQQSTISRNDHTVVPARCPSKHDPIISLASHIIQTSFGTIVQQVADCLQCRGLLSLRELKSYLLPNKNQLPAQSSSRGYANGTTDSSRNHQPSSSSSVESHTTLTLPQIKASLIVLIQHSIVSTTFKPSTASNNSTSDDKNGNPLSTTGRITLYRYHPTKAIYMNHRYAKFVEYTRKTMSGSGCSSDLVSYCCSIVEELLLFGRLRTIDLIMHTIQRVTSTAHTTETTATTSSEMPSGTVVSQRQQNLIEACSKLVTLGFIIPSPTLLNQNGTDDDVEQEWSDTENNEGHRRKRFKPSARVQTNDCSNEIADLTKLYFGDALSVALLLTTDKSNKVILPISTVWTVNISMLHDHLRAFHYGKYVSERYGQKQPALSCIGSLITAALKYRAYRTFTLVDPNDSKHHSLSHFTVVDVLKYIPKSVVQMIEKKVGGSSTVECSIQQIFCDFCSMDYSPHFVRRICNANDADNGIQIQEQQMGFEVVLPTISNDYINRIIYQVVYDRHGAIAARVVSILSAKGYLESDRIADIAMVPAKDTREVLHHLYRSRYVELLQLSSSSRQQYNPSNTIYLWGIERPRLIQRMIDDIAKALHNLRLRRQHEVSTIGAEWLKRITTNQQHQQQSYADDHTNNFSTNVENVDLNFSNSIDRENYTKFCIGLERIDVASMQLDDTLMALFDFQS